MIACLEKLPCRVTQIGLMVRFKLYEVLLDRFRLPQSILIGNYAGNSELAIWLTPISHFPKILQRLCRQKAAHSAAGYSSLGFSL